MKKDLLKKILPTAFALGCFIIIVLVYCYPMLEGKVLNQPDMNNFKGMSKETIDFKEQTGENTYWTNSMFSGMPTYQISAPMPSSKWIVFLKNLYHLFFGAVYSHILGYLIGFYILMRAFGINKWLSIVGAIAIAFSSYFFIIIVAGHSSKALTIGYLAPVIGGYYLIFRKKYLLGVPLVMVFMALGALMHPQMTYYTFLMLGVLFIAEIVIHIKEKRIKDLLVGTGLLVVALIIGIGAEYSKYKVNSEYVKETMRGGHSELVKNDERKDNASGLSLEYATQWSYGISETMTLMIPNFKGGSSHYTVGNKSKIYEELTKNGVPASNAKDICQSLPMYWGNQPFTSGPVYVGAIVCFLFVLGLIIVKGPYKWALLVATIMSILLSWGHNFMGLTKLFFYYFPMYDKFRAVSSILIVAEITIPLLGFLALKTIMDKKIDKEILLKNIYIAAGITAGISLFFALFGKGIFNFTSPQDIKNLSQMPKWFSAAIVSQREAMFVSDAFRSAVFIILAAFVLWLYVKEKVKVIPFVTMIGVLVLIDMWSVDKRFFNENDFINERENNRYFDIKPYEKQILADNDLYFRVLNTTTSTFNDARTSYYLKSIGGYHGAKLRRYQDLIDAHISKGNMNVLNMLNAKYIITQGQQGAIIPQQNPNALGNSWFIDSITVVNTPNEESDALNNINPAITAVTDVKFSDFTKNFNTKHDSTANIRLVSYAPNKLEYISTSKIDKTAVFSDIYYPHGWHAYIDDNPVEHFRVNYVLRALNIPAGNHKIVFEFHPDNVLKADKVSMVFIVIIYLTLIAALSYGIYRYFFNKRVKY